jgi:hypothetical protein
MKEALHFVAKYDLNPENFNLSKKEYEKRK